MTRQTVKNHFLGKRWPHSILLAAGLFVTALNALAQADARQTIDRVERAYGYQIGDLVTRKIRVKGAASKFSRDLLPEPGPVNAWLTLVSRIIETEENGYILTLIYQVTGAASAVALVDLPVVLLRTSTQTLARVDAHPISVSPLIGAAPFQRSGMGDLQPDRPPPALDTIWLWQQLAALLTLLAATLGLIGWRRWRRSRPEHRAPFEQARRLVQHEPDLLTAYRHLHRAFDSAAGRSLFLEDLDSFIIQYGALKPARDAIENFYRQSREGFFNSGDFQTQNGQNFQALRKLASQLAKLERQA